MRAGQRFTGLARITWRRRWRRLRLRQPRQRPRRSRQRPPRSQRQKPHQSRQRRLQKQPPWRRKQLRSQRKPHQGQRERRGPLLAPARKKKTGCPGCMRSARQRQPTTRREEVIFSLHILFYGNGNEILEESGNAGIGQASQPKGCALLPAQIKIIATARIGGCDTRLTALIIPAPMPGNLRCCAAAVPRSARAATGKTSRVRRSAPRTSLGRAKPPKAFQRSR